MQIFGLVAQEASLNAYAQHLHENGYSFEYRGRDLFDSITFAPKN